LPVAEQPRRRVARARVARGADHAVAEHLGARDLRVAVRRIDHRLEPTRVATGGDHARAVEGGADLLVGDRAVGPLVEAEDLEAAVADGREISEDRREATGQRHERPEVAWVVREVTAAQVALYR